MKAFHAVRAAALSRAVVVVILLSTCSNRSGAAPAQANLAVIVRHAPGLNAGRLEGSLQQLLGENSAINSGTVLTGDWLLPGTPKIRVNGGPVYGGVVPGAGSTSPSGYTVTLNTGAALRYLRTRSTPVTLPVVSPPPAPAGARNVIVTAPGQGVGNFGTLKNLTLNANVGLVSIPPGTYGTFTANSGSGFILGVPGSTSPGVYNLQGLALNSATQLRIVGPVVLTVACGVNWNGTGGDTNRPAWLQLRIASGGVTLNSGAKLGALVVAPSGAVTINANSALIGTVASDQFILNAGGLVGWGGAGNQVPVAEPLSVVTREDVAVPVTLNGSDPDGDPVTYVVAVPPAHGQLIGTAPNLVYSPARDFNGPDSFSFRVNDGQSDSSAAVVNITVDRVNDAPSFSRGMDLEVPEDAGPQTVSAWAGAISAGPDDERNQQLVFEVATDQPLLFVSLPAVSPAGALAFTPAANAWGTAMVTVRLRDDGGVLDGGTDASDSQTFQILIRPVNDSPVVTIVTPAAGGVFEEGAPVPVTVEASDVDGAVARVAVLVDGTPVRELTSAPFAFAWVGGSPGMHWLTVIAYDNDGAGSEAMSLPVSVVAAERGSILVAAGSDQVVGLPGHVGLSGSLMIPDPVPGATAGVTWSRLSGPGPVRFSDGTALATTAEFAEPGTYVLKLVVEYADARRSDTLTVLALPGPEGLPPAVRSSQGTDFWLTFLENNGVSSEPGRFGLNLIVTAASNTIGTVTIPEAVAPGIQRFSVAAGGSTLVSITDYGGGFGIDGSGVIHPNAIHVTTDQEVSVQALNYLDYTTDGYMALPTALLGTEYVVLGYPNSAELSGSAGEGTSSEVVGGTQFAVVASVDDTVVTIRPSFTSGGRLRGVPFDVVLQQGESYRLIDEVTPRGDFTGTRISSTRPVAVFSGNKCARVPEGFGACDHLVEQLPPLAAWGRRFLTTPLAGRTNGDTYRIVAARDATLISINGELAARLEPGEVIERVLDRSSEILASEPVLVAQFAHGTEYDGATGDPSMVLVPAVEQFGADYLFATPRVFDYWESRYEDPFSSHLNLVIRTEQADTLRLDGSSVAPGLFAPAGGSGFSLAQIPVPPGTHRVMAATPFGATLYGWADSESYALPVGIHSRQPESETRLTLLQSTAFAAVGTEKVVIARVSDEFGGRLADLNVSFDVSGVNPTRATVRTSRFGEATFSYPGSQEGDDFIRASLADLEQVVTNTWVTDAINQPPVVSAGADLFVNFGETGWLFGTIDDDGRPVEGVLTAAWRTVSGPVEAEFALPIERATPVSFGLPGVYQLELTASDSQFSSRALVTVSVNALPEVRLNVEAPSHLVSVGERLTFTVVASDLDGVVTRVEFLDGGVKIAESTSPSEGNSYAFEWIVPDGVAHELTAVAVDDRGGLGRSASISIRGNVPPTVMFVSPGDRQVFTQGSPIELSVETFDPDGVVRAVYYFANGDYVGAGWGENFPAGWTPSTAGSFVLLAVAEDDDGWFGVSEERWIDVRPVAPTVTLSTTLPDPERGALVGFPLVLTADARVASPFKIDRVDFLDGGWTIGQATNWPFQILYTPTNADTILPVARAYADSGGWAESGVVPIQPVPRLEARWESPSEGQWMPLGVRSRLGIGVDDPGRIFGHADFFVDGVHIAETPFSHTDWTPDTPGSHQIEVRVTDTLGNVHSTPPITVRAAGLNPPQVRITSPLDFDRLATGSPVSVTAEAVDADGVVTNLTLTRFSAPEVSSDSGAVSHVWNNLPPGQHTFVASATDDTGQMAEAKVRVVIELPTGDSLSPPAGLSARGLGCSAIRVEWTPPPGLPAGAVVVIERAAAASDVWMPVAFVPADQTEVRDSFLQPATTYHYRAHLENGEGVRSGNSGVVTARTRIYLPRFAALDLAESLVDGGVLQFADAGGGSGENRWSRVSLDVTRVDNTFLPVTPDYLNGLIPLGLSDNNRVLMINQISATDRRTFLWRPDGDHLQFDREAFDPYRLALPGVPVGMRRSIVQDTGGDDVPQNHAGLWVEEFLDFTPEAGALTVPSGHAPPRDPYPTDHCLIDVNGSGVAVGRATWAYFGPGSGDGLLLPPATKATVWTGWGQPAINFGALELLNNTSAFLAINDGGDIVGLSRLYDPLRPEMPVTHAVRSHLSLAGTAGDKLTDLGTLGGLFSAALSINRSGWVAGYSTASVDDWVTQTRAVYWRPDESFPRELPGFGDALKTYGWAINDNLWIVGDGRLPNETQRAALWTHQASTNRADAFDRSDLNDLVSSSDWLLTSAQYVNRGGFICGQGWHAATVIVDGAPAFQAPVPRVFLLVPDVSLAVDYNRDGRIELNERDDLPEETSYQFWVNDDADSGDEGGAFSDIPGATGGLGSDGRSSNSSDGVVNGTCDLPDWFPVYLNITNLLALFPPESNGYLLRHADGALNFVYTDLRPGEAGSWFTNRSTTGFGAAFDRGPDSADCVRVTAEGTVLNPFFLEKIRSEGRGVLFFEARQPTEQPLQLEVWNHRRVVARVELPLEISGVEDMYGWVNLRGSLGQPMERLSSYLHPLHLPLFSKEDRHVVFVHGYNVNEKQSRGWAAEMFKRLWWSGSNARFHAVSWHGDQSQLASEVLNTSVSVNYQANVINAFRSAPVLASFINGLARQGDVTLIAHSLGNMLAGSAIQDHGARPSRYFMMDAAVAIEAYAAGAAPEPQMTHPRWRDYDSRLFASEWHQLFPAGDGRRTLTWRGRFGDVVKRTVVYNFYSSGEEVLANMNLEVANVLSGLVQGGIDLIAGVTGSHAWGMQETLKGTGQTGYFLSSDYGGWGFNGLLGELVSADPGIPPVLVMPLPAESTPTQYPDAALRTTPFFSPGPAGLYLQTGGLYALDNQTKLLAEMFPARTFAAGGNPLVSSPVAGTTNVAPNFNMNSGFKNGWPSARLSSTKRENWLHSDLRDVAYLFSHDLYRRWVELGAMK